MLVSVRVNPTVHGGEGQTNAWPAPRQGIVKREIRGVPVGCTVLFLGLGFRVSGFGSTVSAFCQGLGDFLEESVPKIGFQTKLNFWSPLTERNPNILYSSFPCSFPLSL